MVLSYKMSNIIVFDNGYIIEQGDHKTLMKNNGKYAEIYKQTQKYMVDTE